MIEIREATKNQAPEIASLIMMAMTDDCCLYFCGDGYGLEDLTSGRACSRSAEQASLLRSRLLADFRKMMMLLVEREDSQYSYKNTLVALDGENVVGISSAMMGVNYTNYDMRSLSLQKNISARITLEWMTRHKQANYIWIRWPCCQSIAVEVLLNG